MFPKVSLSSTLVVGGLVGVCTILSFILTKSPQPTPQPPVVKQTSLPAVSSPQPTVSTLLNLPQIVQRASHVIPPPPNREFRGVWIATVINIDWPSRPGLRTEQQQAELIAILDKAVELKLNAVIFQVRPACDTLYPSSYEPWSESLSGQMGKPPEPDYDPLAFAIEEAHKRGLELHAWFNPYRAYHAKAKSQISANHISKTHPEWVKQIGKFLWLDPGEQGVQDYSLAVIMDVVRRYDIDAIHLDDYFYPENEDLDFPDNASWQKYLQSGGQLSRDDWRRDNINNFIERLYKAIKTEKPWVKFGISPFGIWRPGYPAQIKGFDPYDKIYADSRKWLANGWLDYLSPQLYWKIGQTEQSYPVLLSWWTQQNTKKRHIWPGNYTSLVSEGSGTSWPVDEILSQIGRTRQQSGATGNIHFSMKTLMQNTGGISSLLAKEVYTAPSLVPASPWLNNTRPDMPAIAGYKNPTSGEIQLIWNPTSPDQVWLWVVQTKKGSEWTTVILPGRQTSYRLNRSSSQAFDKIVAVSAVNRYGTQGSPVVVEVKSN